MIFQHARYGVLTEIYINRTSKISIIIIHIKSKFTGVFDYLFFQHLVKIQKHRTYVKTPTKCVRVQVESPTSELEVRIRL